MTEKKFEGGVDGMFVNTFETKYGEIIKLGINVDKFKKWLDENVNEKGYVNIDILTSKAGKKYAKLNTWKGEEKEDDNEEEVIEEEIPF